MKIVETIEAARQKRHAETGLSWGFVPTMGALHEGHLSLVRRANAENDRVAVSIFVNPTQFNNPDDLEKYPRDMAGDTALLEAAGVDLVWTPTPGIIYPEGYQTYVNVEELTQGLEGAHRPGHFRGVATVVTILFNVIQPTRAYFGQKDAQQVAVISQMVRDLAMPLTVVSCPIVREADGLALSSRNQRLDADERQAALILYKALQAAGAQWQQGERHPDVLRDTMRTTLGTEPRARIDYVSAAHPTTLQELHTPADEVLLSMAVYIGEVRLIDNISTFR